MLALPGCPICRRSRRAAARSVESFLWESVNDPQARQPFIAAYGLCPDHTRLLAAADLSGTGRPLATNIMYEQLGRVVSRDLHSWEKGSRLGSGLQRLLKRAGLARETPAAKTALVPRGPCPICDSAGQAALTMIDSLFAELERHTQDIEVAYRASDGLCLAHLREGLDHLGSIHPQAAGWLVAETTTRLERQAAWMQEMIRKNNWEYREEKLTPDEADAWRKMLTFFTGLDGDRFTHHLDDFT